MPSISESEVRNYLGFDDASPQVSFDVDPGFATALANAVQAAINQAKSWGIAPSQKNLSDYAYKVAHVHEFVSPAGKAPAQNIMVVKSAGGQVEGFDAYLTFRSPVVTAIAILEMS